MKNRSPYPRSRRTRNRHPREDDSHGPPPRLLGQVGLIRGTLWFLPAGRIRRGRRPFAPIRGKHPEPGDYVIAECPWREETAKLIEVLGREDDPAWDNLAVLSRARWPDKFPAEVLRESKRARPPRTVAKHRLDLVDRTTFTMDPVDAVDFDDALSWQKLGPDRFEVGIHIADVTHYVQPGSMIDREARRRATSVYLSGGAIPMLPERLSSDLCSLRPDELRFAMSILVVMDSKGHILESSVHESCIRSRARLSYEDGHQILSGKKIVRQDVQEALSELSMLAKKLTRRRLARGGLDLDTAELYAVIGDNGQPLALERKKRLDTHRIVEEFMLLANTLIAEDADRRRLPFLYRIHQNPRSSSLASLERQLKVLGLPRLGDFHDPKQTIQNLLSTALPLDRKRLVHRLALRALPRATYSAKPSPHFGLGLNRYAHFTSPIRRYPDLFNHRQIREWLQNSQHRSEGQARRKGPRSRPYRSKSSIDVAELAVHTTRQEETAQGAERESLRIKSLRFAKQFLGDVSEGTIVGTIGRGIFVELDEPPVEGFCRVSQAIDDRFDLDESGVRLVGRRTRRRFSLGDRVTVAIARVDVAAREMELELVTPRPRQTHKRVGRKKRGRTGRRKGGRK